MADAAFASLMECEKDVRKQMALRVKAKEGAATTSPALVAAATQRIAPKKPVDMNAELRRLGLGPTTAAQPLTAPVAPAAAPRGPAAESTTTTAAATKPAGLSGLLAARKAQVSRAVNTELIGLRTADYDSDDDDDDEPAGGGATALPVVAAGATLAREANSLADPNVGVRQRALSRLTELELSNEQLRPLLQPLLLRFSDSSERCREVAVALFARWQASANPSEVSGVLPFLMPVMVERLGTDSRQEPSEEVRALCVSLLHAVCSQCRQLLRPYLAECGAVALGCCRDNHPEVVKGVCGLMRVVADEVLLPMTRAIDSDRGKRVKPYSTKLIEALLPHTKHRHAAVRLVVIAALESLLLCGAGQSVETLVGWRLKNNVPVAEFYGKGEARINYMADLSRDTSPLVRRRFVQCCARWLHQLSYEDLYEHEVRIAAYLVNGLADGEAATREETLRHMDALGAEYLHFPAYEEEYRTKIEYGCEDEAAADAAMTLTLDPPFTRPRASYGARERFRAHFRALIYPVIAELEMWTATERLQSAQLLELLLIFTEAHATEFAHQILPALAKGSDPDNPTELRTKVARAAVMFAQFVPPRSYLPLALSMLAHDALNPLSQRVQYYALLPALLQGMRPAARAWAVPQLVAALLEEADGCTRHTPLRLAVGALLRALLTLPDAAALVSAPLVAAPEADPFRKSDEPSHQIGQSRGHGQAALAALPEGVEAGAEAEAEAKALLPPPPVGPPLPRLLRALLVYHGSAPELSRQAVPLGEGLEELPPLDAAALGAARDAVARDLADLAAPPPEWAPVLTGARPAAAAAAGDSRGRLDEGAAALWRQHAADVHRLLRDSGAPEAAPQLADMLSEAAAVSTRRGGAAPPEARPPAPALKRVVIEEDDELD